VRGRSEAAGRLQHRRRALVRAPSSPPAWQPKRNYGTNTSTLIGQQASAGATPALRSVGVRSTTMAAVLHWQRWTFICATCLPPHTTESTVSVWRRGRFLDIETEEICDWGYFWYSLCPAFLFGYNRLVC